MKDISKIFILIGVVLILIGILLQILPKIPILGRLPGDIYIEKENFKFYFPLTTSIILSIIISIIIYLFKK